MARGFTLLECVIALVLLASLMAWAIPNYQDLANSRQMHRFSSELLGLVDLAKSEAVYRNKELLLKVQPIVGDSSIGWQLILIASDPSSVSVLASLSSQSFAQLTMEMTYPGNQIKFYPKRGKVSSGHLMFYSKLHPDKRLKLITSYGAGRIRLCSLSSRAYGYSDC
ncbi:GspH/FimT family pseudopilin [Vibrio sp. S4M6]|uniref:GspH/FimT family pseudopilin n=1 Tax=Vibrio sinus TaxID=2946865 RepID=UPI00202A351E|nr:GspH/FimT family pseudopilin [Vibrio sinus]MCL9783918.1 GspH/FimT family pseudopilin [Vibrio sinus]